jgi:hypothetical protein
LRKNGTTSSTAPSLSQISIDHFAQSPFSELKLLSLISAMSFSASRLADLRSDKTTPSKSRVLMWFKTLKKYLGIWFLCGTKRVSAHSFLCVVEHLAHGNLPQVMFHPPLGAKLRVDSRTLLAIVRGTGLKRHIFTARYSNLHGNADSSGIGLMIIGSNSGPDGPV